MPSFRHDDIDFHYRDEGEGLPVIFQHGLGGDLSAPCGIFPPPDGVRRISFDARYHGQTRPLGDPGKLSFDALADDLLALLDHLEIERAVIGGISMGAGISLNFGLRHPHRTRGLILSRPAWLDSPWPENLELFPIIGRLIRDCGPAEARKRFEESAEYRAIARESSDNSSTLLGLFDSPEIAETAEKFERMVGDAPTRNRESWASIAVPTLVLANRQDPLHPMAIAEALAVAIPAQNFARSRRNPAACSGMWRMSAARSRSSCGGSSRANSASESTPLLVEVLLEVVLGQRAFRASVWHFELGRPEDRVEDQGAEVVVPPVLVRVGAGEAEAAASVGPFHRPG